MKTVTKSQLSVDSFFYDAEVKVNRSFITRGYIDGKRHYFLEERNCVKQLLSSKTFTSLTTLKKEIR